MIAATAIAEELPLFTTNPADFAGLDALMRIIPVTRPAVPHEQPTRPLTETPGRSTKTRPYTRPSAGEPGKETKRRGRTESVPFLLELFPEAAVVVIMRLPVHVAASHLDQPWAPSTLDGVLGWLEPVYRRWLAQLGHRPPPAPARPVRDVGPAGVAGPGQG